MAFTIDYTTKMISIPQSDLTNITGTLYEHDSDAFRLELKAWEASEDGIVFKDTHIHNTEVTIAGVIYARFIEMVNGFCLEYTPDSQWSAKIVGSNNNMWDIQDGILIQNQVQVIPTNSAGLINAVSSAADMTQTIFAHLIEGGESFEELLRLLRANAAGDVVVSGGGADVALRDKADTKDRIVATVDGVGNRDVTSTDGT